MSDKVCNEKCGRLTSWVHGRLISGRPSFTLDEALSASSLRRPVLATALYRLKTRKLIVSPMRGFYPKHRCWVSSLSRKERKDRKEALVFQSNAFY